MAGGDRARIAARASNAPARAPVPSPAPQRRPAPAPASAGRAPGAEPNRQPGAPTGFEWNAIAVGPHAPVGHATAPGAQAAGIAGSDRLAGARGSADHDPTGTGVPPVGAHLQPAVDAPRREAPLARPVQPGAPRPSADRAPPSARAPDPAVSAPPTADVKPAPPLPTPAATAHPAAANAHAAGTASAAIYAGVFEKLGALAAVLRDGATAARDATSVVPPGGRDALASLAPRQHADATATAAGALVRHAATAARAAETAGADPRAVAALPLAPEIARIGWGLELASASLAASRAGRRLESAPRPYPASARTFAGELANRFAVLDGVRAQIDASGPGAGTSVDQAIGEVRTTLGADHGAGEIGGRPLFEAASTIRHALDEAAQRMPAAVAPGATGQNPPGLAAPGEGKAGAAVESLLDRAAAEVRQGDAAPSAEPAPKPNAVSDPKAGAIVKPPARDGERPPPNHETGSRSERPARWEYVVPPGVAQVSGLAIAQTISLSRPADLADVLREALATKHQFVIWLRPGITLATDVQALVTLGLIETRQRG